MLGYSGEGIEVRGWGENIDEEALLGRGYGHFVLWVTLVNNTCGLLSPLPIDNENVTAIGIPQPGVVKSVAGGKRAAAVQGGDPEMGCGKRVKGFPIRILIRQRRSVAGEGPGAFTAVSGSLGISDE